MHCTKLFDGESYHAILTQVTYRWLMSGKWVTYADIMANHLGFLRLKSCHVMYMIVKAEN